jgi:hypothetical protein
LEKISSILASIDGLLAGGEDGGGADGLACCFGASKSISKIVRSVPQMPHFFESG